MDQLKDVLAAVGPKLRDLRKQRGVTLADLSRTTGISESTLSHPESGSRRPNLELLLLLAHAYGVPHWLGSADARPVELLVLFGPQGERAHLRARPA
ncbi:helix-turn-helix domain-containing protein [Microbispora rosea]|uniref:helix-turn-helix domain-containing protein n=1 Tax=Microbispora rosea TaxID=58117 RepID=UPI000564BE0A|nr:helix-turn-helix transcriptional regulator [Microbispora rosea]